MPGERAARLASIYQKRPLQIDGRPVDFMEKDVKNYILNNRTRSAGWNEGTGRETGDSPRSPGMNEGTRRETGYSPRSPGMNEGTRRETGDSSRSPGMNEGTRRELTPEPNPIGQKDWSDLERMRAKEVAKRLLSGEGFVPFGRRRE
jgi:hypothetical protein